jgi:hypothetical protein
MSHRVWILISGMIWAVVGLLLLYKGLRIFNHFSDPQAAAWWIALGLFIGFLKGRFILSKTVQRISKRILSLSAPIRFLDVYPKSYWMLIASMVALGGILRFVPDTWHGLIDVTVGSALLNGAMLYVRKSRELAQKNP